MMPRWCSPWHECYGGITLPQPTDTNFLVRITSTIGWEMGVEKKRNWDLISTAHLSDLLHSSLAISAIVNTMTTTFSYSLQLAGMHLHHWVWQANNNMEWTNDILNMGVCTRGPANELPVLFTVVLKLMADCCGYSRPADQLLMRDWSSLPVHLPGTHQPQLWGTVAGFEVIPYTIGNPLAISRFLVKRPLEWGICQPRPIVNFLKEVWVRGAIGQMGWRATAGSSDYAQRTQSSEAYVAVVYGAYALNVLAQMIDGDDAPVITVQDCAVSPMRIAEFGPPHVLLDQPIYHVATRTFQPCTVMSYSHGDDQVMGVCLMAADVLGNVATLYSWLQYANVPVPTAGLSATSFEQVTRWPPNYHTCGILR